MSGPHQPEVYLYPCSSCSIFFCGRSVLSLDQTTALQVSVNNRRKPGRLILFSICSYTTLPNPLYTPEAKLNSGNTANQLPKELLKCCASNVDCLVLAHVNIRTLMSARFLGCSSPLNKLEKVKLLLAQVPAGQFIYALSETFLNQLVNDDCCSCLIMTFSARSR